ncbi:MAG: winged helix-turn-helix domain-containing protein, partial [Granulosicoccaceae bacterium]
CAEESDEVLGFEKGADDYLAKPVRPRVLLARIQALLRRGQTTINDHSVLIGGLRIDPDSRSVSLDDESVELSANEYDLLWLLASSAGEILPRSQLMEQLCGYDYDGFNRAIDVRISRLRKKLNDNPGRPFRIKTVRGKGYLLALDAW